MHSSNKQFREIFVCIPVIEISEDLNHEMSMIMVKILGWVSARNYKAYNRSLLC